MHRHQKKVALDIFHMKVSRYLKVTTIRSEMVLECPTLKKNGHKGRKLKFNEVIEVTTEDMKI